jgi:arylsulfatase A-like enzyme
VVSNANQPDLPRGIATVATYLNEAGYSTGFVGKAHMGGNPHRWGFRECPVWLPEGASPHYDPKLRSDGEGRKTEGYITQIFADAAIEFLEKHKKDTWFLWFATTAPHTPYYNDPNHTYTKAEITSPPGWPKGEKLSGKDWVGYYSTISMLDEQVGRVLKKLDDLGLAENTFVFMAGDNGFMLGSHGYYKKEQWYEESTRVPALARWPGKIQPGTKVASPAVSVDFLPTVLDIAGVGKPKGLEGVSLLPALTGGKPARTMAYSEVQREPREGGGYWQMVRNERWKYVKFREGEEYLYDLAKDPSELKDLATSEKHAGVLTQMRQMFDKWIEATR